MLCKYHCHIKAISIYIQRLCLLSLLSMFEKKSFEAESTTARKRKKFSSLYENTHNNFFHFLYFQCRQNIMKVNRFEVSRRRQVSLFTFIFFFIFFFLLSIQQQQQQTSLIHTSFVLLNDLDISLYK